MVRVNSIGFSLMKSVSTTIPSDLRRLDGCSSSAGTDGSGRFSVGIAGIDTAAGGTMPDGSDGAPMGGMDGIPVPGGCIIPGAEGSDGGADTGGADDRGAEDAEGGAPTGGAPLGG